MGDLPVQLVCAMTDEMKSSHDDSDEDPVQEALKSVERLAEEDDDGLDPDAIEVLRPGGAPPSGDPRDKAAAPSDPSLEQEFEGRNETSLEGEATTGPEEDEVFLDEDEPAKKNGKDPKDVMLEAMIQAKNEALSVLDQTQKEAKSMQERLLRVSADFENYKKRQAREKDEAVKYANERLLKDLLPVLDNADRALDAVKKSEAAGESDAMKSLVDGVEMVFKQLTDTFGRFGVEGFTALGKPFNPAHHEAVAQREDNTVPTGTVIEEYQRGYLLHGRLVRPSMVVVSAGGPSPDEGDGKAAVNGATPDNGAANDDGDGGEEP